MSVKAMSLVWDMACPSTINKVDFKPQHKYILLAYADHADHNGRNIYPAIATIAKKTGYSERNVQNITHDLQVMGILLDDGCGPRGTNRWYLPFSVGGEKIAPLQSFRGEKIAPEGGAIPSGAIPSGAVPSGAVPSGAKIAPELNKGINPEHQYISNNKYVLVWDEIKEKLRADIPKASYETWVDPAEASTFDGRTLTVLVRNTYARDWCDQRLKEKIQMVSGVFVEFVVADLPESENE